MKEVQVRMGFDGCLMVDCIGKSGGLSLVWKEAYKVSIVTYTTHHIDALIQSDVNEPPWRLTCIYGWPQKEQKFNTWRLLARLHEEVDGAWVCIGDFNQVYSLTDKVGGNTPDFNHMVAFRDCMEKCELHEIDFEGPRFTWDNGREEDEFIQEWLDYAFANEPWQSRFLGLRLVHLQRVSSDHVPIMLYYSRTETDGDARRSGSRPSRFEVLWAEDENCREVIRNAWTNPNIIIAEEGVQSQVRNCMMELKSWSKKRFGNVLENLRKVREELRMIHKQGMHGGMIHRRRYLENRENELMDQEEKLWFQRARVNELKWGDKNSSFFH